MAYHEFIITISEPFRDALIRRLTGSGCLGVIEQDEAITAYFPETVGLRSITDELSLLNTILTRSGQTELTFSHRVIPEQDWNETWKEGFHAIDVGERFTILPPWEEKKRGRMNIVIDPAMAFGTGHHGTTRSCLVLMERYAEQSGKEHFLDLGTGTGILAIAASLLGYRRIVAADTDPLAVDAAKTNCALNGIADLDIRLGGIDGLQESFDVIAANIISGVLVRLAPALAGRLKCGGTLLCSGILRGQEDEVIKAMQQQGLILIERYHDGKWVSLVLEKP